MAGPGSLDPGVRRDERPRPKGRFSRFVGARRGGHDSQMKMLGISSPLELDLGALVAALGKVPGDKQGVPLGRTAGVLFLIQCPTGGCQGPVLILNKRSTLVRQPGDLCCPGGTPRPGVDRIVGTLLQIPPLPLWRSRGWRALRGIDPGQRRVIAMYWACCLRESWEEMRLPPWKVEFLGPLPPYRLRMFERDILPMVGSISGSSCFRTNWEVERVLAIPLSSFLDPGNYGKYILSGEGGGPYPGEEGPVTFPCFIHRDKGVHEILWGATYNIVLSFLSLVWGFEPPPLEGREVVKGRLPRGYLSWKRANGTR